MDTDELIKHLDKKIDSKIEGIRDNISYLIAALNNMESSLDTISYLSYLKDDLKQKIN